METLSKQPDKPIGSCGENRAEAYGTKFPQLYTGCQATKTRIEKKYYGHTVKRLSNGQHGGKVLYWLYRTRQA
jgi:hypothetical protein